MKPGAVYRRLLSYARPHLGMWLIGMGGMVLFAATDTSFAWFVKKFMELTKFEGSRQDVLLIALGAPLLFLFRGIGDYMSNYFPGYVGRQVIKAIRADLFRHYLDLPASYYDRAQGGMMLSKLTYNVEQVAEAVTKSITSLIRDTLTIIGLIGYMFWLNWHLALFVFAIAPPMSWLIRKVASSFRRYSARIQASTTFAIESEAITGDSPEASSRMCHFRPAGADDRPSCSPARMEVSAAACPTSYPAGSAFRRTRLR